MVLRYSYKLMKAFCWWLLAIKTISCSDGNNGGDNWSPISVSSVDNTKRSLLNNYVVSSIPYIVDGKSSSANSNASSSSSEWLLNDYSGKNNALLSNEAAPYSLPNEVVAVAAECSRSSDVESSRQCVVNNSSADEAAAEDDRSDTTIVEIGQLFRI